MKTFKSQVFAHESEVAMPISIASKLCSFPNYAAMIKIEQDLNLVKLNVAIYIISNVFTFDIFTCAHCNDSQPFPHEYDKDVSSVCINLDKCSSTSIFQSGIPREIR